MNLLPGQINITWPIDFKSLRKSFIQIRTIQSLGAARFEDDEFQDQREYCVLQSSHKDVVGRLSSIVAQIAEQNRIAHKIAPTDHFVDSGMTSLAMVDLMLAVEAEFDITIPHREMTPTNFHSIAALAQMLDRI